MTACPCANCEKIGGGEKLRLATGTEVCTGTIRVFETLHGPLPDHWLPTTPCTDPWVLPECYA